MLGSVHLVDGGVRSSARWLRRTPVADDTPGLRHAQTVIAAPLGGGPPAPQPGRFGLVAFWDDEASLDRFLETDPMAGVFAGGWGVRLDPLRAVPVASSHFPGVPDDLPLAAPDTGHGPVAVLTIGRPRASSGSLAGRNPLPAEVAHLVDDDASGTPPTTAADLGSADGTPVG